MTSTEPAEESLAGESEDSDLEGKTDGEASDEKEESNDEDGAFELVTQITEDCLKVRGDLLLKEYICSL